MLKLTVKKSTTDMFYVNLPTDLLAEIIELLRFLNCYRNRHAKIKIDKTILI